eukprot:6465799-Amphidinium_carterae.1
MANEFAGRWHAEVSESTSMLLQKLMSEHSGVMLEGENRAKAERYVDTVSKATAELKLAAAREAIQLDYEEAIRRQTD